MLLLAHTCGVGWRLLAGEAQYSPLQLHTWRWVANIYVMDSNCRWCWVGGWVSECTDGWLVNKTDWLTDWGSQQIWRHIVCGCEAQSSLQRTHFGFDKMNNTRPLGVFASNLRFYLSLANKIGCQWHLQRVRVGRGERTRSISESLETNRKKIAIQKIANW